MSKWIPCSDRMPDKGGEYLITIKWEDGSEIYFSWFYLRDRCWSYKNANVVAWMELPEPYKESEAPLYCDRNICTNNEYNGVGCDECQVTKHNKEIEE